MKKINLLLFVLPLSVLFACGGDDKIEETDNIDIEKNPLGAIVKMGENMKEQAEKMEKQMEERKDAEALHYEELMKYLPDNIDGYEREEPKGESINMTGMSYSSAQVRFSDDNHNHININILDYNAALSMYSMATAMWASGLKIDTSEEFAQSININENITGWESFKKKSNKASVVLGVNNRFLITLEGDNQEGTDYLKEIAEGMELTKLEALN